MYLKKESTLKNIKEYLKKLAVHIKIEKQLRKTVYGNLKGFSEEDVQKVRDAHWDLWYYKQEYRYYHIAYCLFRGKTIEQIENKCSKGYDWDRINSIKKEIKKAMEVLKNEREKTICTGA